MSKSGYARFLSAPSADQLHDDAVLHYITTLTTFKGSSKITSHLASRDLKRLKQNIISATEDSFKRTLAAEVETTLEFVASAGSYLPGLDDNFLTDRTVTIPIIHFVHFADDGKIDQIRLFWDQGSLLKQIEVIGARGRNWPINNGPELIKLISSAESNISAPKTPTPTTRQLANEDEVVITSHAPKSNGAQRNGAHASISLFEPLSSKTNAYIPTSPPKSSARPPQRDYAELFPGGESSDATPVPGQFPKAGAQKHYQSSRLFSEEDADAKTPEKGPRKVNPDMSQYKHFDLGVGGDAPDATPYKVSPQKYQHFEFADGHDEPAPIPKPNLKSEESNPINLSQQEPEKYVSKVSPTTAAKHQSQWDFADFSTPAQPKRDTRAANARHFGWSYSDDDEPVDSPIKQKSVAQPRKDAATHFSFTDVDTPETDKEVKQNKRSTFTGLYANNITSEDNETSDSNPQTRQRPLSTVTNMNAHRKVFDSQFSIEDESPAKPGAAQAVEKKGISEDRKKAVNMMNANWDMYDQSPKENRITTAGDGMGGRKGTTTRHWGFGGEDEEDEAVTPSAKNTAKPASRPIRNENWEF